MAKKFQLMSAICEQPLEIILNSELSIHVHDIYQFIRHQFYLLVFISVFLSIPPENIDLTFTRFCSCL